MECNYVSKVIDVPPLLKHFFTERKRRRWDQQASGDDTPAKKKSSWDQAEVRNKKF